MSQSTSDALLLQNYAMLRILCHDVANTLSIIQLTCRQLSQSPVLTSEKAPMLVERLVRTADVQKGILLSAKALAAFFTEAPAPSTDIVDLKDVAGSVIRELGDLAQHKKLTISLGADPSATYYTFGQRLPIEALVFRAIIANAVKYSFPGSTISVQLSHEADNICVTISDQGVGIKEANLPHVFEHGKVALGEGTQGERGMGLGLYLLKFYCDRQGIQISLQSRHRDEVPQGEHGTTVTLRFDAA